MNEFIKPFQVKTDRVRNMITMYETNLIDEVSLPAYKAYLAIKKYFAELLWSVDKRWKKHQPTGAKKTEIRKTNKLHITPELLIEYKGCPNCSTVKNTNSKARSLLKQLEKAGVLFKISKDYYMVSPQYLYVQETGGAIDDAMWEWCQLTGEEYDENIWNATRKVKDYSTGQVGPDVSRSQLALAAELNVPVSGHPETVEELEEQLVETTEDIIERLKNDQRNVVSYNRNIIQQYGLEIARQVIQPRHLAIALNNLKVNINGEEVYLDSTGEPLPF